MKKLFLSISILLTTATSYNPKETYKNTVFYVTDPNGIFLFPNPNNIRSRISVPYKTKLVSLGAEKFSIPSKDGNESKYFEKLLYIQKVYYVEEDNRDKLLKMEAPDSDLYTYTQVPQAAIYSLPFKDSKVIKKLPEFSMLKVVSECTSCYESPIEYKDSENNWIEVESENKVGFVSLIDVVGSGSLDNTKQFFENKVKSKKEIFLVTASNPIFFEYLDNKLSSKQINSSGKDYLPEKGNYAQVIRSLEEKGERYYLIERVDSSGGFPYHTLRYFWISEKHGKVLSKKEFSKISFQNSKFKKDTNLFKIFEWRHGGAVNFETMKVWKYYSPKYNSEFYLANFQYGIGERFNYLIVERKGNQFKEIFAGFENTMALEARTYSQIIGDMDKDGYPEFIGGYTTRGGGVDESQLHTYKNGKLSLVAYLKEECDNFEFDGTHLSCYRTSQIKGEDGNYRKEKTTTCYKYTKGKLYKQAANGKWEEVKRDDSNE